MQLLALLHRWAGGITGLLLAVIGLSGAVLVWEDKWINLPGAGDALDRNPAAIGRAVAVALAEDEALSRITFAGDDFGLHQAIYADGGGAYLTQGGQVAERWHSMWERPELWLFDLHHYLFLGDTGKYVTGVLGLLLMAFTITGCILWWRTRSTFRLRLWPARLSRSAIIRQHRDIGAVASPLLLLAGFTGAMMVFPGVSNWILSPLAQEQLAVDLPTGVRRPGSGTDWPVLLTKAQTALPGAAPRRLMMPGETGAPVALRMKQDSEWTPNGRTYVYLDPANGSVLATLDPLQGDAASSITEKYYPIHAGKVGGILWRLTLTVSGVVLALLGMLASWSFWLAGAGRATQRDTGGR